MESIDVRRSVEISPMPEIMGHGHGASNRRHPAPATTPSATRDAIMLIVRFPESLIASSLFLVIVNRRTHRPSLLPGSNLYRCTAHLIAWYNFEMGNSQVAGALPGASSRLMSSL